MGKTSAYQDAIRKLKAALKDAAKSSSAPRMAAIGDWIERLQAIHHNKPYELAAITVEIVEEAPDNYLDYVLCDYVHEHLFFDGGKDFDVALSRLPMGLQYIWLLADASYQVLNGGFNQFFLNCSGEYALDTVAALIAIGAKKEARMLDKAIAIFEKETGRPANSHERWYGRSCPDKKIEALEVQFMESAESGALNIEEYARKHPEEFVHKRKKKKKAAR